MSQATSTLSKFIGLTGLGLLTGSSLTLALLTTQTLLSLPSTQPASQALSTLSTQSRSLHRILSTTSLAALLAAWSLSPRGARHPYLIWTALPLLTVSGWEWYTAGSSKIRTGNKSAKSEKGKGRAWGSGSEDEDGWRDIADAEAAAKGEINGESVRDGLAALKKEMTIKSTVWGIGWALGLVGIWGDGY